MNRVYTVTQVNQYVKNLFVKDLELNYISVQGEVSNCKYHSSGHIYFTLKDGFGQISCVMFAGHRRGLAFRLEEGQNVVARGSVSVYERDGKYQLYAIKIDLDGQGLLFEKFEKLKKDLEKEGLFDTSYKKPIIKYPETIGIVTAKTGAAIQDIINISKRRNPNVQLILYPAQVQGLGAAESIVKGIKALDNMNVDTIIIGRGGGSIEDLWAFNEEIVARAIYNSKTPIISAVGHETDFTIADFVSDLRAPTPSAAAELAVNDFLLFSEEMDKYKNLLTRIIKQKTHLIRTQIREYEIKINYASPEYQIKQKRQNLIDIDNKIKRLIYEKIKNNKHLLELYTTKLEGLSPLSRLKKGYALVTDDKHKPVLNSKDIKVDSEINISFVDGEITAKVIKHN